jgi:hypothetical protein
MYASVLQKKIASVAYLCMLGTLQSQEHQPTKVAAPLSGLEEQSHSGPSCNSVWKLKAMIAGKEK